MAKSEVIIEVGAERGSIMLRARRDAAGWRFLTRTTDQTGGLLVDEFEEPQIRTESEMVDSWEAALQLLDRCPWHMLHPLPVHPQFREKVWDVVQCRLLCSGREPAEDWHLERWRKLCARLTKADYLSYRSRYQPEDIRLIIVAESPPAFGLYLYNPDGKPSEPLFAALMKQLGVRPTTKVEGLVILQRAGWLLIDATYEPVNKLPEDCRDRVILRDFALLRDTLVGLLSNRPIPVVLIKSNVCKLLARPLRESRFNVVNGDVVIPFPATG